MKSDKLEAMREQSYEVQRRIDRLNGFLWLAGTLDDARSLGKLLTVMQQEGDEMERESEKLQVILADIRKQREDKERTQTVRQLVMMVLMVLMAAFLISGMPVIAQDDVLATNTAEVVIVPLEATPAPVETAEPTPEQPPVVVVQPEPSDKTLYVIGFLAFVVLVGVQQFLQNKQLSTLAGALNRALDNKMVIDEGQRLYMEQSLSVQNTVKLIQGIAVFLGSTIPGEDPAEKVGEFLNKVVAPPNPNPEPGQVG